MKDYKPDEMRAAIEKAGIKMGAGRLGMPTDDDGIRLQLLGVPGGLAKTIIPSTRISTDDAAVEAIGLDHIVLAVTDLDRASSHYEKFFGSPAARNPARSGSRLPIHGWPWSPLHLAAKPAIERLCFRIAGFDKKTVASKLEKLQVETSSTRDHALRFRDPNGFTIELTGDPRRA